MHTARSARCRDPRSRPLLLACASQKKRENELASNKSWAAQMSFRIEARLYKWVSLWSIPCLTRHFSSIANWVFFLVFTVTAFMPLCAECTGSECWLGVHWMHYVFMVWVIAFLVQELLQLVQQGMLCALRLQP